MAETTSQTQPIHHLGHHSTLEESSVTLLVRHLPEGITGDTITRLFSHYGASSVRSCSHGRVKNCAFIDFKNEILASQAQKQLHGLRFLGKVLSVERATKLSEDKSHQEKETLARNESNSMMKDGSTWTDFSNRSRGNYGHASEPIARKLGVDYPFPPHLEYAYPPPDGHILTNIVNALIAVPHFYTQVLHLMNKMNIPAPFRKALPTPPLLAPVSVPSTSPPPPPLSLETRMENLPSDESEMESSEEEVEGDAGPKRKRVKHQAIVGPAVDKDIKHEAVGLKPVALVPKEKPMIKKNNPVLQIRIAPKQIQTDMKDDVTTTTTESQGSEFETSSHKPYATLEQLNIGRLPPEEILSLPKFKNYTTGDPTPVLYVKNLAKDVVVDDIYFVFGSLFGSFDAAKSNLSVKLMQEGRMRGQAFITFPTVELAHNALNVANGFVFKGKPMVIQFGRTAVGTKPSN